MFKNTTCTFPHLPEELLEKIFNGFEEKDLLNCQRVCRAWYKPIHLRLLNCISLNNILLANHFINAIDSNPDPDYLNAVRKIRIANIHGRMFKHSVIPASQPFTYNEETLHKLFFRFPNLGHIEICHNYELFLIFTDELCEKLLQCCPKLQTFIIKPWGRKENSPAIWNMRLLLTGVEFDYSYYGNIVEYITSFPKVRQLECTWIELEDLFQVLERCPDLKELNVNISFPENTDSSLKNHLSTRTKSEQELILKRLSEITFLGDTYYRYGLADFALKYFTGLKTLRMVSDVGVRKDWKYIADLGDAIDEVYLSYSCDNNAFVQYYNDIENAVYREPTTGQDRVIRRLEVQMGVGHHHYDKATVNTSSRRKLSERAISIYLPCQQCWPIGTRKFLRKRDPEREIDEFALAFYGEGLRKYDIEITEESYYIFLKRMPLLKRVMFDVTVSFEKGNEKTYEYFAHQHVEELTLRGRIGRCLDPLIYGLFERLPYLKHLWLICYCGIWSSNMYELDMRYIHLESLSIDIGPIEFRMQQQLNPDFFVVRLRKEESTSVYKVSISLTTFKRVLPHESIGEDGYVTIDITIANVQQLRFFRGYDKGDDYCSFDLLERARDRPYVIINCSNDCPSLYERQKNKSSIYYSNFHSRFVAESRRARFSK